MKSRFIEDKGKFKPVVIEVVLESMEEVAAFSAIHNHEAIIEDLEFASEDIQFESKTLWRLLGEVMEDEEMNAASEAAFLKLDKRLHNYTTHP